MPFSMCKHRKVCLVNCTVIQAWNPGQLWPLGSQHSRHQTHMCRSAITHKHAHWIGKSLPEV